VSIAIKLLSAGAVQPGLVRVIEAFRRETGNDVRVAFATTPSIRKRLGEGEAVDIVIAPLDVLDELVRAGKAPAAERVIVGRIGVGVMVRDGAPLPKIATVDEFKRSLLNAESIVYNQASTGIYLQSLFERLGIAEQLAAKTTRYPDFAPVLDHISKGKGAEIGLGATTVISEAEIKGLKFVGPLPPEIQNYTTYGATVMVASASGDAAQALIRYLITPGAKALFTAAGVE
jgi:molybdate transport system substrate-binding protein